MNLLKSWFRYSPIVQIMKILKHFVIIGCALLFAQCKSSQPTGPSGGTTPSVLEVSAILDSAQSQFVQDVNWNGGNAAQAIQLTADWLQDQPNVSQAYTLDSTYITIVLKSGLSTCFYFEQVDDSGYSILRGGGEPSDIENDTAGNNPTGERVIPASAAPASHSIANKHVLIFAAGGGKEGLNLEPQIARTTNLINNSELGLDVTVFRGVQCSAGVVANFKNYGLVILDTHGEPGAFLIGSMLDLSSTPQTDADLKTLMDAQVGAGTSDDVTSGNLELAAKVTGDPTQSNWQKKIAPSKLRSFFYSSKSIDLLPAMQGTVVFGNMCNSGFTALTGTIPAHTSTFPSGEVVVYPAKPWTVKGSVCQSFINKGLISYYGYTRDNPAGSSRSVPDDFAAAMEDTLVRRLMNGDSTQIANLSSDNATELLDPPHLQYRLLNNLYFRHYGANNYSYSTCADSMTDPRDGQVYKTVCIGNQTWMAQNLNYDAPGSVTYNNDPANGAKYGRMYDWATVMQGSPASSANPSGVQGVCPKGWHVPSAAECATLSATLGGDAVSGGAMKSTSSLWQNPNTGATNSSGFSFLPVGYYAPSGPTFIGFGTEGLFWNTFEDTTNSFKGVAWGGTRIVQNTGANATVGQDLENTMTSCRCVKDP
jgi:uncharacterized protein (TIGR02145 family)